MRLSEKSRLAVNKSESESSEKLKSEILSDKKPPEASTEKYSEEIKIDRNKSEEKQIKIETDKIFEKIDDQKIEERKTENSSGRMSLLGL